MIEQLKKWSGVIQGVVLVGAGVAAAQALHNIRGEISNSPKTLSAAADSHAAVLGILAGLVAAIVALLLTIDAQEKMGPEQERARIGSVAAFMCTFLTATITSFHYASYSGLGWWMDALGPEQQVAATRIVRLALETGYSVSVFLCFYGFVLAITYLAPYKELENLARFMLLIAYLHGIYRTVVIVSLFVPNADVRFLAGACLVPMGVALALPRSWPARPRTVVQLLFGALACSLVAVGMLGLWYAELTSIESRFVTLALIANYEARALFVMLLTSAVLIPLLVVTLNRISSLCEWKVLRE